MRIGTLLGIAVGVAACAESPAPVAPHPMDHTSAFTSEASSSELVLPFSASLWISCANNGAGESVSMVGSLSVRSHEVTTEDGVTHLSTHYRPMGVVGVSPSGRRYRGTGGAFEGTIEKSEGSVYTAVNNFRIIGQGPSNNMLVHFVLHQTVNANGEVTASVNLSSNECR